MELWILKTQIMVIFRKLVCPDGYELVSRHRHDFVQHDDANGKWYMLDGGHNNEYFRSSANGDEKFIEITTEHPFNVKREHWEVPSRENYKLKDAPNKILEQYISLCMLSNCVDYRFQLALEEKLYRNEKEIYI